MRFASSRKSSTGDLLGRSFLVALCACATYACASATATRARGPDGRDDWWHISCRDSHEACNDKAKAVCENGFEVAKNTGRYDYAPGAPFYSGDALIRCNGSAPN